MKKRLITVVSILLVLVALMLCVNAFAKCCAEPAIVPEPTEPAAPKAAFSIDVTNIVIYVVRIVLLYLMAWIATKIVPPIKAWFEAHTTVEERKLLYNITDECVRAAEQLIKGPGRGAERLEWVYKALRERGITADRVAIEAAVREMNTIHLSDVFGLTETEEQPAEPAESEQPEDPE